MEIPTAIVVNEPCEDVPLARVPKVVCPMCGNRCPWCGEVQCECVFLPFLKTVGGVTTMIMSDFPPPVPVDSPLFGPNRPLLAMVYRVRTAHSDAIDVHCHYPGGACNSYGARRQTCGDVVYSI